MELKENLLQIPSEFASGKHHRSPLKTFGGYVLLPEGAGQDFSGKTPGIRQGADMSAGKSNTWLWGLLPVAIAGAWGGGRLTGDAIQETGAASRTLTPVIRTVDHFKPAANHSRPAGQWIAEVKLAQEKDFAALVEELDLLYPEGTGYFKREAARRWILGLWIVRNPEAAAGFVASRQDERMGSLLGLLLGELAPQAVEGILAGPHRGDLGKYFERAVGRSLAEHHPEIYLENRARNSKGESHFVLAVKALAAGDPVAAADYWENRGPKAPGANAGLAVVVSAWAERDPDAAAGWIGRLEAPETRRMARHAWLAAMAKKDLPAARRALVEWDATLWSAAGTEGVTSPEPLNDGNGRLAVLGAMAKQDLPSALAEWQRLIKDGIVEGPSKEPDPFASKPDSALLKEITAAVAPGLPGDPAGFFETLRRILPEGGELEATHHRLRLMLIKEKSASWPAAQQLEVLRNLFQQPVDVGIAEWTRHLVQNLASRNPEASLELLSSLPEAQRGMMADQMVVSLHFDEAEKMKQFAALVPPGGWTAAMGAKFGALPETGAAVLANLPETDGSGAARIEFSMGWAKADPEAAARWVEGLQADQGAMASAGGVAAGWAGYDETAASGWVNHLPPGQARDGAAAGLADTLAGMDAEAAWQWAASVSDVELGLKTMGKLARTWGNGAPPEFREHYLSVLASAGMDRGTLEEARQVLEAPPGNEPAK